MKKGYSNITDLMQPVTLVNIKQHHEHVNVLEWRSLDDGSQIVKVENFLGNQFWVDCCNLIVTTYLEEDEE